MNTEDFAYQITAARWRLAGLEMKVGAVPQPEVVPHLIEELHVAFEELRVAEQELRQQNEELLSTRQEVEAEQQRYYDLFEFAPDGYVVTSVQGVIREANRAAARMFGVGQQFLVGKPLALFVVEYSRRGFRADIARLRRADGPQEWEVRMRPQQGAPFDAILTVVPARDWNGQVNALRWMMRDVTARKQDQEQIRAMNALLELRVNERTAQLQEANRAKDEALAREREARAAAEAAQQQLAFLAAASTTLDGSLDYESTMARLVRLIVPQLADWCVVDMLDADGAILQITSAHADPSKERLLVELQRNPLSDAGRRHFIDEVLRSGRSQHIASVAESELATLAGAQETMLLLSLGLGSLMSVPLIARGRTLGAISFVSAQPGRYGAADLELAEDLAGRAALAIDNALLYREAQEAMRLRESFMQIVSQEIKSPLSAIISYAELLERRVMRGDTLRSRDLRGLRSICEQGGHLIKLVDVLLDVSRIETGQLTIAPAPVDLRTLAQRVVADVQPALTQHTLELSDPGEPLVVRGDATRLEQVLQNLLQNAVKYSPSGGAITLRLTRSNGCARIAVDDRGIGIPDAAQPQLFQRFYRAGNVDPQQIGGLGLGLYMVKEIIDLHGGQIEVASVEGGGSTFTVDLPLA